MSLLSPFIPGKGNKGGVKGGNCLPDTEREAYRQLAEHGEQGLYLSVRANGLWPSLQSVTLGTS